MLSDQHFDVVVDRARQIEISYIGDDGNKAKKNKTKGSSSFPQMHTMGDSQSHHSRRIIGNKKAGHKHRTRGFRPDYGSSSGQSLGYNSSRSGLGCGQQGHFARECPMFSEHLMGSQGSVGNMPRQMHPGTSSMVDNSNRAVDREDVDLKADLEAGVNFRVSQLNVGFKLRLGRNPTALECSLSIVTLLSGNVDVYMVFSGSPVVVDEKILLTDLVPLPVMDFDVILEMDWLSNHYATLDYKNKSVYFHIPRVKEFSFDDDKRVALYNLVSVTSSRKMLRHGCHGYLTLVRDTSIEGINMKDVPIVRKFMDVFPKELLELPLEFCINIVPGTNLISMPPYRMAPTELKELKEQLQELLNKGFVRPSTSP
ncbi:uncharacterized protein LOC131179492 [Hevea brasiliensis]|uniref:uncharacterized protein LOC131179492 n=1 Tax=Hevea brasiliensis TaxID=3981 RepID=UPI0025CB87E4|nr:uncharacterized protein LOC131179492 [Hevea brasiliensis]